MGWINGRLSDLSNLFNELKALLALDLKLQPIYALGQNPKIIAGHSSDSGREAGVTLVLTSLHRSQEPHTDPDTAICSTCASQAPAGLRVTQWKSGG